MKMKKPAPKKSSQIKGGSSDLAKPVLDVVKELVSTANNVIGWRKEAERTQQAQINADAQVVQAKEKTQRTAIKGAVDIADIGRKHLDKKMEHEAVMKRLQIQSDNDASKRHERELILDKMLEDPQNNVELVNSYRIALLADDNEP
jgi:hypothetical protein